MSYFAEFSTGVGIYDKKTSGPSHTFHIDSTPLDEIFIRFKSADHPFPEAFKLRVQLSDLKDMGAMIEETIIHQAKIKKEDEEREALRKKNNG